MSVETNGLRCERRRTLWICPRCDNHSPYNGHRCQNCHRVVCCPCFDHLDGVCGDWLMHMRGQNECVAQ